MPERTLEPWDLPHSWEYPATPPGAGLVPHRPGHATAYHPGEASLLAADIPIVTKAGSDPEDRLRRLRKTLAQRRPGIPGVEGDPTRT